MDIYLQKFRFKQYLLILAVISAILSLLYTFWLVQKLSQGERRYIALWAEAVKELEGVDLEEGVSLVTFKLLRENTNIPAILVDENQQYITSNREQIREKSPEKIQALIEEMKADRKPIVIQFSGGKHYIYYQDSVVLRQLFLYPFFQFGIVVLFIVAAYVAFSASRRAEENQVWVGMSKETAHQLGTPISSLIAWVEMLKFKNEDQTLIDEVAKDVQRLETITERFSKIGSTPVLKPANLIYVLQNSVNYISSRTSNKVQYNLHLAEQKELFIPMNIPLFEWVIENLCKNAIDAMAGAGSISISLSRQQQMVVIDITDTGKGLPKNKYKTVFKPGYTSKKRGWGLGLSLAKRIIESYHQGKIFILNSIIGEGTTFRIILNK